MKTLNLWLMVAATFFIAFSSGFVEAQECPRVAVTYETVSVTRHRAGVRDFSPSDNPNPMYYLEHSLQLQQILHHIREINAQPVLYSKSEYNWSETATWNYTYDRDSNRNLTGVGPGHPSVNSYDYYEEHWLPPWINDPLPLPFSLPLLATRSDGTGIYLGYSLQNDEVTPPTSAQLQITSDSPYTHKETDCYFSDQGGEVVTSDDFSLVEDLSVPYTLDNLKVDVSQDLAGLTLPGTFALKGTENTRIAELLATENNRVLSATKGAYRINFLGEAGTIYFLQWSEIFVPQDGGQAVIKRRNAMVVGSGEMQASRAFDVAPPSGLGQVFVLAGEAVCSSCIAGSERIRNGSIDFSVDMGRTGTNQSAGRLVIYATEPNPVLATPAGLNLDFLASSTRVVRDAQSEIIQVQAFELAATIETVSSFAYKLLFYHVKDLNATLPDGTRIEGFWSTKPGAEPHTTYLIENVQGDVNKLKVTKTHEGRSIESTYSYSTTSSGKIWELTTGNGLRKETKSVTASGAEELELLTIQGADDRVVYKEQRKFQRLAAPLGRRLSEIVVDPDGAGLTTTFEYYLDPVLDADRYGLLKRVVPSTGAWKEYFYLNGMLVKEITGYLNSTPGDEANSKVVEHNYNPLATEDDGTLDPDTPRTTITKVKGKETSRAFAIVTPTETRTILAQDLGATHASSRNLITVERYFISGDLWMRGKLRFRQNPDGTRELYTYSFSRNPQGEIMEVTETTLKGAPDETDEGVGSGTKTVTVMTSTGREKSRTVYDIESPEIIVGQSIVAATDDFGRPTLIAYPLDATSASYVYRCCGLERFSSREGKTSIYEYDDLARLKFQSEEIKPGEFLRLEFIYDAEGRTLEKKRRSSDAASTITLSSATYDKAGRLLTFADPVSSSSFTFQIDAMGQLVETVIRADLSTAIKTFFRDGSPKSRTGTAVHPERFEHGVRAAGASGEFDESGNFGFEFTTAIKPEKNGTTTSEEWWTTSYVDPLKRPFKDFASGSPGAPRSHWFYNSRGQLVRKLMADGVGLIWDYNSRGELEYTSTDLYGDGQFHKDGTNRISRIVSRVLNEPNYGPVHRDDVYAWVKPDLDSAELRSSAYSSTDGKRTWTTLWNGSIGVTSRTERNHSPVNKETTLTEFHPDGTKQITVASYGYVRSVKQAKANGDQLALTSFDYDVHGRRNREIDARNGETAFHYNDKDQLDYVESPKPDASSEKQRTQYHYDNMGRVDTVTLPDLSTTTTQYHLTGQPSKVFGSRVFTTGYGYDDQGRMKLRTNWCAKGLQMCTEWKYYADSGLLESIHYPDDAGDPSTTNVTTFTYTDGGRMKTRTWSHTYKMIPVRTEYSYNPAGELASVAYSDATPDYSCGYNRLGQQDSILHGETLAISRSFNFAGLLVGEAHWTGPLASFEVHTDYNEYLQKSRIAVIRNGQTASETDYHYLDGRLDSVNSGVDKVAFGYETDSLLVRSVTRSHNETTLIETVNSHDHINRLRMMSTVRPGGQVVDAMGYTPNIANQVVRRTDTDASFWDYDYDSLGQLRSARKHWPDNTPVAGQQYEFAFDEIGNPVTFKVGGDTAGGNLRTTSFRQNGQEVIERQVPGFISSVGVADPATTVSVNDLPVLRQQNGYFSFEAPVDNSSAPVYASLNHRAVFSDQSVDLSATRTIQQYVPPRQEEFRYDNDGNLTRDSRWSYEWDGENRLLRMRASMNNEDAFRHEFEHTYDHLGRRVQTVHKTWDSEISNYTSKTKRFVYDGWDLLAEIDEEGNLATSYAWADRLLWVQNGGITHFALADQIGTVRALVDSASGEVSARYEYGPFGDTIRAVGPMAEINRLRYSSKYCEVASGLIYYGYRHYSPDLRRWLSRDPIGYFGGANPFAFVGNDPVNRVDEHGLLSSFAYAYLAKKFAAWGDNTESVAVGLVSPAVGWALGTVAGFDPIYNSSQDVLHLYQEGPAAHVRMKYELLEEAVGTADLVRAADYAGEYTGWEQFMYGASGMGKSLLCILGAQQATASFARGQATALQAESAAAKPATQPPPIPAEVGAAEGTSSLLPVKYNPDFAALQKNGQLVPSITPEGNIMTDHAANTILNGRAGRPPMSVEAVDEVLMSGDNIYKYSTANPKGATVGVQNTQMPGKPVVVVDAASGKVVVTVMSKVKK